MLVEERKSIGVDWPISKCFGLVGVIGDRHDLGVGPGLLAAKVHLGIRPSGLPSKQGRPACVVVLWSAK